MANRKLLFVATLSCAVAGSCMIAGPAAAATYSIPLTGVTANFQPSSFNFNGEHYDRHDLTLDGLSASNAITVAQGDNISSTVTFDNLVTIPQASAHNNFLQYFFGNGFPSENTGVTGTFNLYNGANLVASYGYSSTTSGQLASYAALFPPNNPSVTFNSFTNNFIINTLATPATIDSSRFSYDLVSPGAVPEPAIWAMMIMGFGIAGAAMRRQNIRKTSVRYA